MQVSKKRINKNLEKRLYSLFYQVVADIHHPKEAEEFLKNLLSPIELEVMVKRLAIAYYLDKDRSYQEIKTNLAVSSATVSNIAEQIKRKKGFQIALKKIRADEWADKWGKKISKMMRRTNREKFNI